MKHLSYPQTAVLIEGLCYGREEQPPVYVRIGVPVPDPKSSHGDVYCPIEVRRDKVGEILLRTEAYGINALQGVENAFRCIRENWSQDSSENMT